MALWHLRLDMSSSGVCSFMPWLFILRIVEGIFCWGKIIFSHLNEIYLAGQLSIILTLGAFVELPKNAKCMMDCEAALILKGIEEQMVVLSEDPTIKIPL